MLSHQTKFDPRRDCCRNSSSSAAVRTKGFWVNSDLIQENLDDVPGGSRRELATVIQITVVEEEGHLSRSQAGVGVEPVYRADRSVCRRPNHNRMPNSRLVVLCFLNKDEKAGDPFDFFNPKVLASKMGSFTFSKHGSHHEEN